MIWYILGCIVSGSFGFLLHVIVGAAKESAGKSYSYTEPIPNNEIEPIRMSIVPGNRAKRRRQWRESWRRRK